MGYCVGRPVRDRGVGAGTANRRLMAVRAQTALVRALESDWIHHRAVDILVSWVGLGNSTRTDGQN